MKTFIQGKVGKDFTTEQAQAHAKLIARCLLKTVKRTVGDLDKVKKVVKIVGFVNCTDDYKEQPEVINGCSNFMMQVFGPDKGAHARSAVGTNSLPRQVPVEIEAIFEIEA